MDDDLEDGGGGAKDGQGGADNFKFIKVEERGLSELVRQTLGKPLNKSEQMSDWERRPLRDPQVMYAGKFKVRPMSLFTCKLLVCTEKSLILYSAHCINNYLTLIKKLNLNK